ncbi:AAA family ATPase [Phyllobacterium sp. SYP-B3895]|uniref:AAA family ATPase n=1 Tax=Phyllobacterium sp. SYP-B3895 TaxID=2663240 RepID=UPI0012998850|nr:ATP-binding protein [Phyllobacterium sp. SYP-B3895]MRG57645.1 AAA family ATPase [Phyllobacterium sp. SYP-B3895]
MAKTRREFIERIDTAAGRTNFVLQGERPAQRVNETVDRIRAERGLNREALRGSSGARPVLLTGGDIASRLGASAIIAAGLGLELFRVNLSGVVSKYIGETERNLKRLFDEAERSGGVLLFDEADALFGKRSEVKDAHDRHANVEVDYLRLMIENYDGVVILATGSQDCLPKLKAFAGYTVELAPDSGAC